MKQKILERLKAVRADEAEKWLVSGIPLLSLQAQKAEQAAKPLAKPGLCRWPLAVVSTSDHFGTDTWQGERLLLR